MHSPPRAVLPALFLAAVACTSHPRGVAGGSDPVAGDPSGSVAGTTPAPAAPQPVHPSTALIVSLPIARAPQAPYALRIVNLQQRPWTDTGIGLVVQTEFEPQGAAELIALHPRLVHCVTPDGVDHAQPEPPYMRAHYPTAGMSGTAVVGTERERVELLEIACTVLEIEEREDRIATGVPAGRTEALDLGDCRVTVTGEPSVCWIATCSVPTADADGARRTPRYSHDWANEQLQVTDAEGVRLASLGGVGSGGSTARMFVHPAAMNHLVIEHAPQIAYPLRIVFPEPVRVTARPLTFRWVDLPLPPVDDGR